MKFASPKFARPKEVVFDLTNFIDVVLLLIIFFMMTAQFAKSELKQMDLPKEKGDAPSPAAMSALVIEMDKTGGLAMLGRPTDMAAVTAAVQSALAQPGSSPLGLDLMVRADRSCPAAHLNRLAEALAGMGVRTWKLATQNEGG